MEKDRIRIQIKNHLWPRKNYLVFLKNYLAFCIDTTYSFIIGIALEVLFFVCLEAYAHDLAMKYIHFKATSIMCAMDYLLLISFNATIQEVFFSTTLGKKICGLVVTTDEYKRPKKRQIIVRNLLYPLDTFWVIGSFPLLKGNGKTFGGYISKTKLVSKKELEKL